MATTHAEISVPVGIGGELVDFLRVRNFEMFQHYSKRRRHG